METARGVTDKASKLTISPFDRGAGKGSRLLRSLAKWLRIVGGKRRYK
jgi:hypothetical protein